jgi:hypothetical protein
MLHTKNFPRRHSLSPASLEFTEDSERTFFCQEVLTQTELPVISANSVRDEIFPLQCYIVAALPRSDLFSRPRAFLNRSPSVCHDTP